MPWIVPTPLGGSECLCSTSNNFPVLVEESGEDSPCCTRHVQQHPTEERRGLFVFLLLLVCFAQDPCPCFQPTKRLFSAAVSLNCMKQFHHFDFENCLHSKRSKPALCGMPVQSKITCPSHKVPNRAHHILCASCKHTAGRGETSQHDHTISAEEKCIKV